METNRYEELIERSYRAFESNNIDELDNFFHKDVIIHTPDPNIPADKKGIEYFKEQMRIYTGAFPEMSVEVKEIFVKGDKGIAYVTVRGRNTGELNGMPPTNKEVSVDFCEMFTFKNDKISEYWGIFDNLSFMKQLGLVTDEDLQRKMEH